MKILNLKILFVFFVSLAFCSEDEKYTLQYKFDYGKQGTEYIEKLKHTKEWSFHIPTIGYVKYTYSYISLSQYLGQEGEFYKFKSTVTNMESDNSVNNINIRDYYREAMEGRSCYIYIKIDGNGLIDHIVPVDPEDDYLQEAYEATYMGLNPINYRYPFGRLAQNISIGGSWNSSYEELKFYLRLGSPPSQWNSRAIWELKKVKDKKGRKIAHIDVIDEITADLNITIDFLGERQFIAGNASGISDVKFQWDVENTGMLSSRTNTVLEGDFEMDGEIFSTKFYFRQNTKRMK